MRRKPGDTHDSGVLPTLDGRSSFEQLLIDILLQFISHPLDAFDSDFQQSLSRVVDYFQADGAGIIRSIDKHSRFQLSCLQHGADNRPEIFEKQVPAIEYPWFADMFNEQTTRTIARRSDLPAAAAAEREFCERHSIESAMFMPLITTQTANSGFVLFSRRENADFVRIPSEQFSQLRRLLTGAIIYRETGDVLADNRMRVGALAKHAPEAIMLFDVDKGLFVDCNDNACSLLGMSPAQMHTIGPEEMSPQFQPDGMRSSDKIRALNNKLKESSGQIVTEHVFKRSDGSEILCEVRLVRLSADDKTLIRASITDIGERERSHRALRESEERLRMLIEAFPDPIFIVDEDGRIEQVFASDISYLYAKHSQIVGKTNSEIFDPETAGLFDATIQKTISVGKPQTLEYSLEIGGERKWFHARTALMQPAPSGKQRILWSTRDITERVRMNRLIETQRDLNLLSNSRLGLEETLERLLQKAIEISEMDCGGIYLADERSEDLTLMYHTGLSEEFAAQTAHYSSELLSTQQVFRGEIKYTDHTDTTLIASNIIKKEGLRAIAILPVTFKQKVIACINIGSHTIARIPAHTRIALESIVAYIGNAIAVATAEDERRHQARRLNSIFRAAPIGIGLVSDRILMEVNDHLCSLLGYTRQELIGQCSRLLYPTQEEFETVGRDKYAQIRLTGSGTVETRMQRKDGTCFDVLLSSTPLDQSNLAAGVTFTVLDISAFKNAQANIAGMLEFEKLVSRISSRFLALSPNRLDDEMTYALQLLGTFFDADRCAMILDRTDRRNLHPDFIWSSERLTPGQNVFPARLVTAISEQWKKGNPAVMTGSNCTHEGLDGEFDVLRELGYRSHITVPVKAGKQYLGGFGIDSFTAEFENPAEIVNRLLLIGEIFAHTILRIRSEISLQDAFAEIKQLKDTLQSENVYLKQELKYRDKIIEVIGESSAIHKTLEQIEQVAATNTTVLLLGETGTGKGLLARTLHKLSARTELPLIEVNCATLPSTLAESELFGHEKGAFTSANARQIGRFELADHSTIFLDEIGELSASLQAKLLRVLQEGTFERLGSGKTLKVDVRVIAASNRDLAKAVEEGKFREDLYYRLNVFPIHVPPLRNRPDDIPILAWEFVKEFSELMGKPIDSIPRKAIEAMKCYAWPGNIRELRNVIERAVIISSGPTLKIDPLGMAGTSRKTTLLMEDVEREHIQSILLKVGWRVRGKGGAAELLGLKPTTLYSRMQKLGIQKPDRSVDI